MHMLIVWVSFMLVWICPRFQLPCVGILVLSCGLTMLWSEVLFEAFSVGQANASVLVPRSVKLGLRKMLSHFVGFFPGISTRPVVSLYMTQFLEGGCIFSHFLTKYVKGRACSASLRCCAMCLSPFDNGGLPGREKLDSTQFMRTG